MKSIFEYTDYRKYLKDFFDDQKKADPKFSHRFLALRLGLSTPNFIMLVMQGKRRLSRSMCFKISKAFRHTKREAQYLDAMVAFMQAQTHDEKARYFGAMMELRRKLKVARIEEWQYDYYSNWYNVVIRDLVTHADFDGDMKALARRVSPSIRPQQAERSVELLKKLGLIKKHGKGYAQRDPVIGTGPEVHSVAVVNFHRTMARLAAESYDRHTRKERTITACTLNMSQDGFELVKRAAADFRKEVLQIAESDRQSDRVFQLNIQFFPVSKPARTERGKR